MEYKSIAKSILQQFGITRCYCGYDYILYGINLIMRDENFLNGITKVLYLDIAKEYHTSCTCVERNIRKVIEVIWKHTEENHTLILKIFGPCYIANKPSNKIFLQLLYEYVKSQDVLERIFTTDKVICPISKDVCIAYKEIVEKLTDL